MIANVVESFLKRLVLVYGGNADSYRRACEYQLRVCREISGAWHGPDRIVVLGLDDPRYRWLIEVANLPIHRDAYRLMLTPGCDQADLLLAIAEGVKERRQEQWEEGLRRVDRALIAGSDLTTRLRREVWSAVRGPEIEETFICMQGENLAEAGFYEMQDLANRKRSRFIVLVATEEPDRIESQFIDGAGKSLVAFRHVEGLEPGLDALCWVEVLGEVRNLLEESFKCLPTADCLVPRPGLVLDALISSLAEVSSCESC